MSTDNLLHLGCGELVGPHWCNVDGSPNVILDNHPVLRALLRPILPASARTRKFAGVRFLDLRRPWPFATATFDGIYSSHVLEHLSLDDGQHVLRECFRCLRPGGRIRFLVPSIGAEIEEYLRLKRAGDPLAATAFARLTNVFPERAAGSWWYRLYFAIYNKNLHRMFYDAESLAHYLGAAGFEAATVRGFLQTSLPHLAEVERQERHVRSVCVEAQRPSASDASPRSA